MPEQPTRAILIAAVLFRACIFVFWEHSNFDSDQAVMGLMAKHIVEGRAFPVFFYGQYYILGVEAWLAAPLFLLAGTFRHGAEAAAAGHQHRCRALAVPPVLA